MKKQVAIMLFVFTFLYSSIGCAGEVLYNPGPVYRAYGHITENGFGPFNDSSESDLDGNPSSTAILATYSDQYWNPVDDSVPSCFVTTYNWTTNDKGQYPGWTFWFGYDSQYGTVVSTAICNNKIAPVALREVTAFNYTGWSENYSFEHYPAITDVDQISFDAKIHYFDPVGAVNATTASIDVALQVMLPNNDIYHYEIVLFNGGATTDMDGDATNDCYWSDRQNNEFGGETHIFFAHGDQHNIPQLLNNNTWRTYNIDFESLIRNCSYFPALPPNTSWSDCVVRLFQAYATSRGYNIALATKNASITD